MNTVQESEHISALTTVLYLACLVEKSKCYTAVVLRHNVQYYSAQRAGTCHIDRNVASLVFIEKGSGRPAEIGSSTAFDIPFFYTSMQYAHHSARVHTAQYSVECAHTTYGTEHYTRTVLSRTEVVYLWTHSSFQDIFRFSESRRTF